MVECLDTDFIKKNFSQDIISYRKLCAKQFIDFSRHENNFKSAVENNDRIQIKKLCHYFKSSFSYLGWSQALSALSDLSEAAESDDPDFMLQYQELSDAIKSTQESIENLDS